MIRLRVALGKNVHRNIGWINPDTASNFGINSGDILIDRSFGVAPFKVEFSDFVRDSEIALPMTILYRLGAEIGEEREFMVVDDVREASDVVLFVVGDILDWINYYREVQSIFFTLDDEIPVSPRTSVRVIDIDGAVPGEVYRLGKSTNIKLLFSGPINLAVAIDASSSMVGYWYKRRKIDIAREVSKVLLEYNLRKANNAAIFGYAEDIDILLNWISIDPKLRWFMTKLIPNFVTNMIISRIDYPNLELALEKIIESFKKRGLGGIALNSLLVIQATDVEVNENRIKELVNEFSEVSNGVWRTFWVGIGNEGFEYLGKVARMFGGILIKAKTPGGLIKKCRGFADFRFVDRGWS